MRSAVVSIGPLAIWLMCANPATGAAETYLGADASEAQVKDALLHTRSLRSLSRPRPASEAAPAASTQPAGAAQGADRLPTGGTVTAGTATFATAPAPPQANTVHESVGPASFEIFFDLNSARLRQESLAVLDRLGVALGSPELQDFRFIVEGHTDASGSAQTNLELSQHRAKTVRDYLVEKHHIDPARLQVRGRGDTDLYDPKHPRSPKNRRVSFVNPEGA